MPEASYAACVGGNDQYTSLLLHMNGTDASNTFSDSSRSNPKTVTANGNAQIDTSASKFGGASGLFDGTYDYLTLDDGGDFQFGNGDFTIDIWLMLNDLTEIRHFFESRTSDGAEGFSLGVNTNGKLFMWYNGDFRIVTSTAVTILNWFHMAFVKHGTSHKIYIDGEADANIYTNDSNYTSQRCWIGRYYGGTNSMFNGWMDEYCISKGIARYTANFDVRDGEYT